MVKTSHAVEYYNENTPPYYRKRGFKDRANIFFWNACCYNPRQVRSEPQWACHDLQMWSTVDFTTEENGKIFSGYFSPKASSRNPYKITSTQEQTLASPTHFKEIKNSVAGHLFENNGRSQSSNKTPIANIQADTPKDGSANIEVFWEVLGPKGWQSYTPRINKGIEDVYRNITLQDVENINDNYKNNWWCDRTLGDMLVYRYNNQQISPLLMVQRDTTTGSIKYVRRREVEVLSGSLNTSHLQPIPVEAEKWTASSSGCQENSLDQDQFLANKKHSLGERFQRDTTRPSTKACRNSEVLVERSWLKEKWDYPENQEGSANQQGVATSSCHSQKEQPFLKKTKPGLSKSREESCSRELYPADIQPAYPCITVRHACEESLLLQYHDQELSESSVLSLMSSAAARYKIQRVKSGMDGEPFQKAAPSVPCELIRQPCLRNKSFRLGNKFFLCSLIESGNEDLDEKSHTDDQFKSYGLTLHKKNALPSISKQKHGNFEELSDHCVANCDQMRRNDEEKPQNMISESVVSTICSTQDEPVKEDSNKCCKERLNFVLPALRSGKENNIHQGDDLSIKRVNKKSSGSTRSFLKIESDSTSPPQSEKVLGNTPDRCGLQDRRRKCADCRSVRLFNDEYPLLIVESNKKNVNDYTNFDEDMKALLQMLETTTNDFRTSVL